MRHDGALGARKRVEQRGLPRIRPPDERHARAFAQYPPRKPGADERRKLRLRSGKHARQSGGHVILQLLRVIDGSLKAGKRIEKLRLHGGNAFAQPACELRKRAVCAAFRPRVDEIHHGLGLRKIQLPV